MLTPPPHRQRPCAGGATGGDPRRLAPRPPAAGRWLRLQRLPAAQAGEPLQCASGSARVPCTNCGPAVTMAPATAPHPHLGTTTHSWPRRLLRGRRDLPVPSVFCRDGGCCALSAARQQPGLLKAASLGRGMQSRVVLRIGLTVGQPGALLAAVGRWAPGRYWAHAMGSCRATCALPADVCFSNASPFQQRNGIWSGLGGCATLLGGHEASALCMWLSLEAAQSGC